LLDHFFTLTPWPLGARFSLLTERIKEAKHLSAVHAISGGHCAFDIFHVATALHLGAGEFLTFDANQKKPATTEGLKAPL